MLEWSKILSPTTRTGGNAGAVALVRPMKMIWVPVLAALFGFTVLIGSAHPLTTYRYHGDYDHKIYERCDYVGRHPHSTYPTDGKCPWFVFTNGGEDRHG